MCRIQLFLPITTVTPWSFLSYRDTLVTDLLLPPFLLHSLFQSNSQNDPVKVSQITALLMSGPISLWKIAKVSMMAYQALQFGSSLFPWPHSLSPHLLSAMDSQASLLLVHAGHTPSWGSLHLLFLFLALAIPPNILKSLIHLLWIFA
jgi:hypothetical protein